MNWIGKIVFSLASSVAMTGLCANSSASNSPYEPIVARNVFDLNPPQPIVLAAPETPVKLTPDGIMTIFGSKQVLFYADVPPHPPMPATQKSYILSEGQEQDGIEVKHIDEKNGMITFVNHGVTQDIPLAKAAPITTPTPVVMRTAYTPPNPNIGRPAPGNPGLENRFGQNRNFGAAARNFGNPGSTGAFGNAGSATPGGTTTPTKLTPEEQMIMIAAQHAEAQQKGDPIAKIFPPTPLDNAAGVTPNTPQGSK